MSQTRVAKENRLVITLVCVIGIMGMWLFRLGSQNVITSNPPRGTVPVVIVEGVKAPKP